MAIGRATRRGKVTNLALAAGLILAAIGCASDAEQKATGTTPPTDATTGTTGTAPLDARGWAVSYTPGGADAVGRPKHGTEIMDIVADQGRLFASTSSWEDPTGFPQILRLDAADQAWVVDTSFDQQAGGVPMFSRTNALAALRFTTDGDGRPLDDPVTVLVAAVTSRTESDTVLFARDNNGTWTEQRLPTGPGAQPRSLAVARDSTTGVDRAYVGTKVGIFSGTFDPAVPGRIRWGAAPEPGSTDQKGHRVMSLVTVGGVLHALAHDDVLARTDGPDAHWQVAWHDDHVADTDLCGPTCSGLRGGTEVPGPRSHQPELLVAEEGVGGRVLRLDPAANYEPTVEARTDVLLSDKTGQPFAAYTITAYNRFTPLPGPDGATRWATGVQAHARGAGTGRDGSFLLIRDVDATYDVVAVDYLAPPAPSDPNRRDLVAVRALAVSPFDPNHVFIGGFDCNGRPARDTAWIYRGELPNRSEEAK